MLSRLVVIGNGFDLAHGLHTKYSDFMKYLCSYEKPPQIIYDRFVLLDTLEKVYGIPTSNILYIHGNALRGNNLILGHHNAALFQEQVIPAFNAAEEHGIYL